MIIIDEGHGMDTPGKRCEELHEWEYNRIIGRYLREELVKRKIDFATLVPEINDIGLYMRVERARKYPKADLLLSIHGNAFSSPGASGIETWYYSQKGKEAAKIFQKHLVKALQRKDRGIKKGNFYIIKKSPQVAVLVEIGFYTNPEERKLMLTEDWQRKAAGALADSIQEYESNNRT